MKVLISGAGIAGPTLAYWLLRHDAEITFVEKAPRLRTGGYIIDFWGAGFEIADRMGLLPEIHSKGYKVQRVRVVNEYGKEVAGFSADVFDKMTHGRFSSLPRGDLAAMIFAKVERKVESIFGDSVTGLRQSEKGVCVSFERDAERHFDIVVGADGLSSKIRELAFGPQSQFEKYLGYKAAAFEIEGYRPRDELIYVMFTEVGQQTVRFAMRDDRTLFLLTFEDGNVADADTFETQKALLRKRFGHSGWECPQILAALDSAKEFYFDRVSQIRMESRPGQWTNGRVILLGDAASCVSLLAGQGSSLAMTAAYILAGELNRARGDFAQAFVRYQELFGPFVLRKQKAALRFAGSFAPKSRLTLVLRNQVFKLMGMSWLADLAVGRDLADHITLPEYS